MVLVREEKTEVGSYFISNYPPFSFWKKEFAGLAGEALDRAPAPGTDLGLYLHIPFCRKRCKFCYFRVYTDRNARQVERYLAALTREVELYSRTPAVASRRLRFVYFGGGTPSFLSEKQLLGLAGRLEALVSWKDAEEVTFECEPGTLTESKLRAIREIGVTRLSLGVENFSDAVLAENGRAHRSPEILRAYGWARAAGFDQINIDLIAGMVGETWENWQDCVRKAADLAPDSVTIYQMELPFNAVYATSLRSGQVSVADWSTKRTWVSHAFDELGKAGYRTSSAYTLMKDPGTRFVYRDALWGGADMIGAGVASFSHVGGIHFQNLDQDDAYQSEVEAGRLPVARALAPTPHQLLVRSLILQLKLGEVRASYFREKFGVDIRKQFRDAFDELKDQGLVAFDGDRVCVAREGLLRVDGLLPLFFEPEHRGARYT